MGVVKNGGFGDGGMTFTRLTSQHFLKVRGNTHLQVEFRKKNTVSESGSPSPNPCELFTNRIGQASWGAGGLAPLPGRVGVDRAWGGPRRCGAARSCDSAPGRGAAPSLCSLRAGVPRPAVPRRR